MGSIGDIQRYHAAYVSFCKLLNRPDVMADWLHEFMLAKGEAITFNQRRLLHGRRSFQFRAQADDDAVRPTPRHLQGTYVNIDDFASRYRVLRHASGMTPRGIDDTRHIGSRSH